MTIELTAAEARYVRDSLLARRHLILDVLPDCNSAAERLELGAQVDLGATLIQRLDLLLILARKEKS